MLSMMVPSFHPLNPIKESTSPPVLNRRSFIGKVALSGLLAHQTTLLGQIKDAGWRTAVGLNGFASSERKYGKSYELKDVLAFIQKTGFDGVELVQGWRVGNYPDPAREGEKVNKIHEMFAKQGLQVFSIQTGGGWAFAPDRGARADWIRQMMQHLKFAQALGCECLGIWPGGGLRGQSIQQAIDRLSESFRIVSDLAGELDILVAFEIEPPFVFNTEDHLERILAQTSHPNLKTIYDPSHFDLMNGSTGRPHEMLQRIGVENIGYVHLTDTDGTIRDQGTSKHLACGDGHTNIPESLRILRHGGFDGWIMIDAWEIPDPYDACRMGLHHIRKALES
jgi:sugar phosphate isomerase/epimerase